MRRINVLILACVLLIGLSVSGCEPEPTVVTFPDLNLETAIREAVNKPSGDIYASELAVLVKLSAEDRGIENLSGLQHCANLTDLRLQSNDIDDISPLTNLTNLRTLVLGSNQISNISSLVGLTNLRTLILESNQISDISPLANLTSLTDLRLQSNNISDISPLASLTKLTHLRLGSNQISDIGALVGNEGLGTGDTVYLTGNPLSSDSINTYIPQLEARNVTVNY